MQTSAMQTYDMWCLELPRGACHCINSIGSTDADSKHSKTTSIWSMRVCILVQSTVISMGNITYLCQACYPKCKSVAASQYAKNRHKHPRCSIILQDNLMNNSRPRFPEFDAILASCTL